MHLVINAGEADRDVLVTLDDPDATVDDLIAALGLGAVGEVGIVHGGRRFGRNEILADLGLEPGSRIALDGASLASAAPVAEHLEEAVGGGRAGPALWIVDGPDAGRVVPVAQGIVVGRNADVSVADPTLSAQHLAVRPDADGLHIEDLGSRNGTFVGGDRVRGARTVRDEEVAIGATVVRRSGPTPDDAPVTGPRRPAWGQATVHNRPPRQGLEPEPEPLAVPDPPSGETKRPPFNVAAMIGPVVMGAAMVALYRNPRFAMFALLSPIMAIANFVSGKRRAKKAKLTGDVDFAEAVTTLDRSLAERSTSEARRRRERNPDPVEVARRAAGPSTRLWERRRDHDDFLEVALGRGPVPWQAHDEPAADVPDELAAVLARWRTLHEGPVTVSLADGPLGLCGDRAVMLGLARWLVAQSAVHHGPADVRIVVATTPERLEDWDWVKWFPHASDPVNGSVRVAAEPAQLEDIVDRLGPPPDPGQRRVTTARDEPKGPTTLVIVDDPTAFDGRRSVARSILRGDRGPATGIVLADTEDRLPALCPVVVTATVDGDVCLVEPAARLRIDHVTATGLSVDTATSIARDVARFEDAEQEVVGGDLPTATRLLPLLGLADPVDPGAVSARWRDGGDDPPPRAPIGIGETGVVDIDLAKDGPHALVGGTTGSGKSELLRSWVAGLAASLDPDDLVFVLVDYKGGSAFDECARLPHTVGMVTDLDEHLGERALRSLEAELHHRERVFRDAAAADLPTYRAAGSPLGPMPRLVVVIDEFATLANELPDFLGALVGIAQRGRSLGVHLVLATQRPQGSVNANIKANTNLRVSLRVQDSADSSDIIDRPDAAAISAETPGRLYLRRGHGDLAAVQSARSTGPLTAGSRSAVTIEPFAAGVRTAPPAPADDGPSELTALVDAIIEADARRGAAPPRRPWLEMLDDETTWAQLQDVAADGGPPVPIAIGDDPDRQKRVAIGWDPVAGNVGLFGMVGSGVTTAVRALVRSAVEGHPPTELHCYIVDGGGELDDLASLPHVGAVVGLSEQERLVRLVRLLSEELERRRSTGAAARADDPTIALVIDGFGSLVTELGNVEVDNVAEDLRRIVNEGPGVGIVTVAGADRPSALGTRYGAALSQRFLFRLADPADFGAIGVRPRGLPAFVPGRFIEGADQLVSQVPDPGVGWIDDVVARQPPLETGLPEPIRTLPTDLDPTLLPAATIDSHDLTIPLGIRESDLEPVSIDLGDGDHAVLAGPPQSGRTTMLVDIARRLRAADPALVLVGIAGTRSGLNGLDALDAYGTVADLSHVLRAAVGDERRWVILVDDAGRVDDDGALAAVLASNRPGLHVIAAGRPDDFRGHSSWTRPLRRSRTGALLRPDLTTDGDVFTARLPRRIPVTLVAGRGFVVRAGEPTLAQFASAGV